MSRAVQSNMPTNTIVLHLDFHKTIQLPKVTSQEAYYKKRLTTRLFGIFDACSRNLHAFIYPCTVGGEGPDEVISLLDFFLHRYQNPGFLHLVLWADNCPGQFKENFLFFFCDHLVQTNRFLRVDLKFLLEGHTYSICDRRFASIEAATKRFEIIESPRDWISKLNNLEITNVVTHEVPLNMIKCYKTFLRDAYVSRNIDVKGNRFQVRKLAWLSFGRGETEDENGLLVSKNMDAGECLARLSIDPYEKPVKINYLKKKQGRTLNIDDLTVKSLQSIPVPIIVKENCVELASKYLSSEAKRYYESLSAIDDDVDQ